MNAEKYVNMAVIGFVLIFLMSGCANYGKLRLESGRAEKMTIQELQENWDDYSIYYADWRSVGWTGGIIFDPKKDGKTLVGDKWMKVEDKETLSQVVASIEAKNRYPRLYQILGPNDEFYGYMYLGPRRDNVNVFAKVIDSNSLRVSDLQPRILGVR
ncbi:MAG: hypothetical protein ACNYWU_08190 [Desulfobacterales bacterium]